MKTHSVRCALFTAFLLPGLVYGAGQPTGPTMTGPNGGNTGGLSSDTNNPTNGSVSPGVNVPPEGFNRRPAISSGTLITPAPVTKGTYPVPELATDAQGNPFPSNINNPTPNVRQTGTPKTVPAAGAAKR